MSVEDKKRLGRRFFKGYTKLVESKYWYNHYVALIFGASPASNLGSLIAIDWKGNELISVTRFFGNNDNVKLYLGSNPETNMYELWLGLIGLDGDGSEFIIQSRESIDLDSKTVETLPSYLKVISISWQKNNDFSELGELIPLATNEANGLMSKNNYIKIAQSITSTKLIKIESWDGYSTLVFIRTSGATGLYSIDGNWADSAKFTRLSGPLGKDHFNAYREGNGNIYVKTTTQSEPLTVTSVGSNHVFKFEESDKDVDSLIVLQWSGGSGGTGLYRTTRFLYQRYGSPIIPINRQQAEILV